MGILGTVSSLLRALAAYWELKSKRYAHDIREQSRTRCEALEDQLIELRNDEPTASDTLAADRVRDRLLTEKEYFKSLSDSSASSGVGDGG